MINPETSYPYKCLALVNAAAMLKNYMPCAAPYFVFPYGCFCGLTRPWPCPWKPIDQFDEICKVHDYCYEDANAKLGCTQWDDYVYTYKWHDEDREVH